MALPSSPPSSSLLTSPPNRLPPVSSSFAPPPPLKLLNCHSPATPKLEFHHEKPCLTPSSAPAGGDSVVKMPAPPWTRGPLLVPASDVVDFTRRRRKPPPNDNHDDSLTGKVPGGRNRRAMQEILRGIPKLRDSPWSPADHLEKFEEDSDGFSDRLEAAIGGEGREGGKRMPWIGAEKKMVFKREKKERVVTSAEKVLEAEELDRLRREARKMRRWVKAKKAGITNEVVDDVLRSWRNSELAMVKIVEPLCRNMDRAREIAETKTGGLVVWSRKDVLVIYRGNNYQLQSHSLLSVVEETSLSNQDSQMSQDAIANSPANDDNSSSESVIQDSTKPDNCRLSCLDFEILGDIQSVKGSLYEREADRLLDSLGPRFIDWWYKKPLPVDADLLPEVVPGFRPPFRRCPPGMKPKLRDDELSYLRKLARPLPTHFALGKNKKLEGLAAAIIKLWEKCPIAKIAVKVGLLNTNHERMSRELKCLTGGVVILRNKFFILLYRGKDFLPVGVANSIFEREMELDYQHFLEEEARSSTVPAVQVNGNNEYNLSIVGSFTEFQEIQGSYRTPHSTFGLEMVQIEAEKEKLEKELKEQERRLFILNSKIEISEKVLAKVNSSWSHSNEGPDQELLTEEERQTFRKIGLKMDDYLLLGRRGIYDGVIGSIHQHWKHKEVVKVITMQQAISQISYTASLLETESGGVLVAVEKRRKGHVIIIYRGKNYKRPLKLLPENLLTKREALQRSIEVQRRGSLKFFAFQRKQTIWELKQRLKYLEDRAKELMDKVSQDSIFSHSE